MKVVIYGATGMVGQGVLRECLLAPDVEQVLSVARSPLGQKHEKLRELLRKDLTDYNGVEAELDGYDACFFCLGVTSAGTPEADYRRIMLDLPVAAAKMLSARNRTMTFVLVTGAGTDANSPTMWARVKGEAENAIFAMPFKAAYAFRPGIIQPMHGESSRTRMYRIFYAISRPLLPVIRAVAPNAFLTTEQMGRAMLNAVRKGASKRILDPGEIATLAA